MCVRWWWIGEAWCFQDVLSLSFVLHVQDSSSLDLLSQLMELSLGEATPTKEKKATYK